MTKKELEKEAEEWVISNTEIYDDKFGIEYETEPRAKEAYLAGAEPREKSITELEAQIEKMKCPLNCKNGSVYNWSDNSICMDCEKVRTLHEDNWQELCEGCEYWERR